MTQNRAKSIASPLIAPDACSLVVIAPTQQDLAALGRRGRTNVRSNLLRILSAAFIVDVPRLVYSPCAQPTRHGLASRFARVSHREFVAGPHALPWRHQEFRNALSDEDRFAMVIAGFWFEHEIVATTLHALADSYDVYFVLDASPVKMQTAAQLSQDRLIQAGATPVVVSQVIHEWSLEQADSAKAAALTALLLSGAVSSS